MPISHAALALAACIRQAARARRPVVVTQKGAPAAILVDVELYQLLVALAKRRMPA